MRRTEDPPDAALHEPIKDLPIGGVRRIRTWFRFDDGSTATRIDLAKRYVKLGIATGHASDESRRQAWSHVVQRRTFDADSNELLDTWNRPGGEPQGVHVSLDLTPLDLRPFEIVRSKEIPELEGYLKDHGLWPASAKLAATKVPTGRQIRAIAPKPGEVSLLGEHQAVLHRDGDGVLTLVSLEDPQVHQVGDNYLLFDPGSFFELVEEHAWHDGVDVALPREDRIYLLGQLEGTDAKRPPSKRSGVIGSSPGSQEFPTEEGDMAPDQEEPKEEAVAAPDDDYHDDPPVRPLTEAQKKVVRDIHINCGHPPQEEFLRALRLSRAKHEVLDYVRKVFKCAGCDAKDHPPKPSPPATLPKNFRFNETVGMDLIELESFDGEKWWVANMLCWGTLFQIIGPVADKTAETAARTFIELWTH